MFFLSILYAHDNRERLLAIGINPSYLVFEDGTCANRNMKILHSIDYKTAMRTAVSFCSYSLTVVFATYLFKKVQFMRRIQKCN